MVPRQFQIGMFINSILATSASLFMCEFLKTILECQFLIGFSNFDLTPAQSVTMPLAVVLLWDLKRSDSNISNHDLSCSTLQRVWKVYKPDQVNKTDTFDTKHFHSSGAFEEM